MKTHFSTDGINSICGIGTDYRRGKLHFLAEIKQCTCKTCQLLWLRDYGFPKITKIKAHKTYKVVGNSCLQTETSYLSINKMSKI